MSLATASFAISPTSLSTYFLLDCELYLRWNTPIKKMDNPVAAISLAEEKSFQIPQMPFKKSPLFEALTQEGFRWEEEIVSKYLQCHLVFLPRPLLEGSPAVLDSDRATRGLAYMQRLEKWVGQGENKVFPLTGYPDGVKLQVYRR